MSILITGGLGYIGSHTAKLFHESGLDVVILDDLSTGRRENARWGTFIKGDIADVSLVRSIIRTYSVTSVLHLAASAHVGDSMDRPDVYFANNVRGSLRLLEAMMAEGVRQFVFASSCSIYGNSGSLSAHEEDAVTPVSPYGESKLQTERALPWYQGAYGLRWLALRYFNVAGAKDDLGEDIASSVRIIPRVVHSVLGEKDGLEVFGTDFPTVDGSAVRDFVHVDDVAQANLKAISSVEAMETGEIVNIGSGTGASVFQIMDAVRKDVGRPVPYYPRAARHGDPAHSVSDISKARNLLGWDPVASSLLNIVGSVVSSYRSRLKV
jgi:UDP-glucose 4-epimerase